MKGKALERCELQYQGEKSVTPASPVEYLEYNRDAMSKVHDLSAAPSQHRLHDQWQLQYNHDAISMLLKHCKIRDTDQQYHILSKPYH